SPPAHWRWTQLLRAIDEHRHDAAVTYAHGVLSGEIQIGSDERSAHFVLYDHLRAALTAVTRQGPLVLVVDDLHAADASSLTLVRLLGGDLHRLPVLVVATLL